MTEQSIFDAVNTAIDAGFVVKNTRKTYKANAHRLFNRVPPSAWNDFGTMRTYYLAMTDARKRAFGVVYRFMYERLATTGEVAMVPPNELMTRTFYLSPIADPLMSLASVTSFGLLHEARWRDVNVASNCVALAGILLHSDAETALNDLLTYYHPNGLKEADLHLPIVPISAASMETPMATDIMEWLVNSLMTPDTDIGEIAADTLTAARKRGLSLADCDTVMTTLGSVFAVAKQRPRLRAKELAEEAAHLLDAGDVRGFYEIWEVLTAQFMDDTELTPRQRLRWHRAPSHKAQIAATRYDGHGGPTAFIDRESLSLQQTMKAMNKKLAEVIKRAGAIDV